MKFSRMLPAIAAGLTLSACAMPWQVAEVQDAQTLTATAGTPFTKALTAEYKAQAAYETDVEHEWQDAVIFARKAKRAAGGEMVAPEDPTAWKIPADTTATLVAARARLMGYFDTGARERVPAASAKAQAAFDCWVEESWEGDADDTCMKTFIATEPELKAPAAPVAHKPTVIKTFVVYFDFDRSALTPKAKKTLHEVVVADQELKPAAVYVIGHTDTTGSGSYNMALSQRRANTVASSLESMGVKVTSSDVTYFGKDKPAVKTGDNVRNAENRRVVITFEK